MLDAAAVTNTENKEWSFYDYSWLIIIKFFNLHIKLVEPANEQTKWGTSNPDLW